MSITFTLPEPGRVVASGGSEAEFVGPVPGEPFMLAMSDGTLVETGDRLQIVIAGSGQPRMEDDGSVTIASYIAWVAVVDPSFVHAKAVATPDVFDVEDETFLATLGPAESLPLDGGEAYPDPMMATFTLNDGGPVTICFEHVEAFMTAGQNTMIMLGSGKTIIIKESYDQVAEVVNPERQDGC